MTTLDNIKTVHCLFEQTGTFRDAFQSLGYASQSYDIEDNFGQTDVKVNLFTEIWKAYDRKKSIFRGWNDSDFVMAFFPCTYFNQYNRLMLRMDDYLKKNLSDDDKIKAIIRHSHCVQLYFETLNQLLAIALRQGFRMIIENPCTGSLIRSTFYKEPDIIDSNRALLGDSFRKPTLYWFVNCKPSGKPEISGYKMKAAEKSVMGSTKGFDRSRLTPEYARNFIRVYLLGQPLNKLQTTLF